MAKNSKIRLLYVTRKYPPAVGGMEKMHFDLSNALAKKVETSIIYESGLDNIVITFAKLYIKTIIEIVKFRPNKIILADAMLSLFIPTIKLTSRSDVYAVIHGLDVTFGNKYYQYIIPFLLDKTNHIISISEATKAEVVRRGITPDKVSVIPVGINLSEFQISNPKKVLQKNMPEAILKRMNNKKILITVGRLVKRKGHDWFIRKVMPSLPDEYIYLIVGDGAERKKIEKTIEKHDLHNRVYLLGEVTDEVKIALLHTANAFIMPNIEVQDDPEGFGIVALEAAACGLPTIATDLQGIRDAVKDHSSGFLVDRNSAKKFQEKITQLESNMLLKNNIIKHAEGHTWNMIVKKYLRVLNDNNK